MTTNSITTVHLRGTPRERGRELGERTASIAQYYWREILLDLGERAERPMTEDELLAWLRERAAYAAGIAPDLDEELHGIAEGADVPYEMAFAINSGDEVNTLAAACGSSTFAVPDKHCLSIIVPPERSATGGLLMAQTWDGPDWTPAPWLLTVEEASGTSAFLTDPGWIGGAGVNDHGVASVHTGVGIEGAPVGLGYSHIARRMMQSATAETAAAAAVAYPSSGGCHYVAGDAERAFDALVAGELRDVVAVDGWLSTCFHFEQPEFEGVQQEGGKSVFARSMARRIGRILTLAQAEDGPIEPRRLFDLFADHADGDDGFSVCLHAGEMRVLGTVVADARTRTVWASVGSPCEANPITEVRLTEAGPQVR
jgi:isopenicillin-N N-acyltransferase-like protein